ncbi:hypothetical protein KJ909_02995 [Patescibacteria group bacterium]|nr:hypothetical protein [Patescibacteria group bacterium]
MKYKVLITTSGIGNHLGEMTKYTNQSLLKVGDKPSISYIIENYPKQTNFVITLGHFGQQIKDFLQLAYPHKNFTFVTVDNYQEKGSNLVYSMLQAEKDLQCPFIFHTSDSITTDPVPFPQINWCGGYKSTGSSLYRSFDVVDNYVQKFHEKGKIDPDFIHIGLIGIHDYQKFWQSAKSVYKENPNNTSLSDVHILSALIKNNLPLKVHQFKNWYDVGKLDNFYKAQKNFKSKHLLLEKKDESIFFYKNFVIKFFFDSDIVRKRVKRAKLLKKIIPRIESHKTNFYRYRYAKGEVFSKIVNTKTIIELIKWAEIKLWTPPKKNITNFPNYCRDFYIRKTNKRVKQFYDTRNVQDTTNIINGIKIPKLSIIMELLDHDRLCNSRPTLFHGDFILDNILKTDTGFCLLDWRQDFAGVLNAGDKYYDLAKLNHNLTLNHQILVDNLFKIKFKDKEIDLEVYRRQKLVDCQNKLLNYLKIQGYDITKINILTSLVWLNMSPLHQHPLDLFLYYFGKYNLWTNLIKSQNEEY